MIDTQLRLPEFELKALNKDLRTSFFREVGPSVNLGNARADDVIALETPRRGLRSDTLLGRL